ncbi:MAG: hypothetical protein QM496_04760 [Verrucomicrobiota bacterium]
MLSIDNFSDLLVRNYWATIRSNRFPMPPNEPVEESVEEILADISYQFKADSNASYFTLQMNSKLGEWWRFGFKASGGHWELIEFVVPSEKRDEHRDLLAPPYGEHLRSFLDYIVSASNAERSI